MSIEITAGDLTAGLNAALDLLTAARDNFQDMDANRTVLLDAEQMAQPLVGGALSVLLVP